MENGQVTQEGTYEDLLKSGTAFEQLVNAHKSSKTTLDSQNHEKQLENQASFKDPLKPVKQNSEGEITVKGLSAIQLTEDEKRETGELGLKPYKDYISVSKCSFLFGLILLTQSLFVLLQCLATYWLAFAVQMHHFASGIVVGVYAIMSTSSCIFAYIRSLLAAHLGLKASKAFFSGFMDSLFKAPMLFFDSTPMGRIVTRVLILLLILFNTKMLFLRDGKISLQDLRFIRIGFYMLVQLQYSICNQHSQKFKISKLDKSSDKC